MIGYRIKLIYKQNNNYVRDEEDEPRPLGTEQ